MGREIKDFIYNPNRVPKRVESTLSAERGLHYENLEKNEGSSSDDGDSRSSSSSDEGEDDDDNEEEEEEEKSNDEIHLDDSWLILRIV